MLGLRSLQASAAELLLLRRISRPNGFTSQKLPKVSLWCLSNSHNSTCLSTRKKLPLQQLCCQIPLSLNRFENHRCLNQDSKLSKFVGQHEKDELSEDYQLIYSNDIVHYYRLVYYFLSPITLFGVVSSASLIWKNYEDFFQYSVDMGDHPFMAGCVFFLTSSVLMFLFTDICKRVLLRIYLNPQTGNYVAIKFPWKQQIEFTQTDVQVKETKHILPFLRKCIEVKGKPFLITDKDFINIGKYSTFVGAKHHKLFDDDD